MIKSLEDLCVNFLLNNISYENVFSIFQFCVDCEVDKRLMERCLEFLHIQECFDSTDYFFDLTSFLKISHKCLMVLLKDDLLYGQEKDLFNSVCFSLLNT